jgi:hypothetical protein
VITGTFLLRESLGKVFEREKLSRNAYFLFSLCSDHNLFGLKIWSHSKRAFSPCFLGIAENDVK